jgi:peptidoglycan/LPS O-acetylase OafA/YrhL
MREGLDVAGAPLHRERMRHVDTLRAIAALLVVWLHAVHAFSRVNPETAEHGNWFIAAVSRIDVGHLGVVVFFLISGFVIPFSIPRDAPAPAGAFLIKRFFRIFPAYWLSVPLAAAANFWIWGSPFGQRELLVNLTLLQGLFGYRDAEGVYWTLPVELVYYLVCTALLLAGSLFDARRVGWVAAVLFATFAVLVPTFGHPRPPIDFTAAFWFLNLSIMLWGTLYRSRIDAAARMLKPDRIATLLFWALLAGYVVVLPLLAWMTSAGLIVSWLWTYMIGFAIFIAGTRFVRIETRLTDWLGRISYSIYLFHVIVFMTIEWWLLRQPEGSWWRTQPFGLYAAAGLVAVLALSTLVHHLIEKPGMRIGHRLAAAWEARAARRAIA